MSKKIYVTKHLEKGRFYIHGDSRGGHPALLFFKNDNKNEYYILVFTSSKGRKRRQLKHSIEPSKVQKSYVHNRPEKVKRRELSNKTLNELKIHKDDKPLIRLIERKK